MRVALVLVVVAAEGVASANPAKTGEDDPHPGIHHEHWQDATAQLDLVQIDLTSQEIALYATKESDAGLTTSGYADRIGAQVAINGDAFAVAGYIPRGLAIGDSTALSNTADDDRASVMHLRRVGERTAVTIVPPEIVVDAASLPDGTQGAVSGRALLVRSGVATTSFDCDDAVAMACVRAPRTAVGVSADGTTMWLVVVDGWQASSLGMTAAELAAFMKARGAYMATALDSGSSSTMVIDNEVISHPSDGYERHVANHLGVRYGALPKGQLFGLICRDDVIACRNDLSLRLPGATVTLDDGRVQTVGSDASYDFTKVTPRLACVKVHKDGYKTKTQCQVVDSGSIAYNSVALEAGEDPPPDPDMPDGADAGQDASPGEPGNTPDGGGGTQDRPPGAGCCDAGGSPGGSIVPGAIALAVVLRSRRRRT